MKTEEEKYINETMKIIKSLDGKDMHEALGVLVSSLDIILDSFSQEDRNMILEDAFAFLSHPKEKIQNGYH